MSQPESDSTSGTKPRRARTRMRKGSKLFRRTSGALALLVALFTVGLLYAALSPNTAPAQAAQASQSEIDAGKALYQNSCISCHGANLQGVQGRGPSLIGVGSAATYFQLATGRMPATENGAQMARKAPVFTERQIKQLEAYVQANGGGPQTPTGDLRDMNELAKGGELFRLNCASCHNFTGQGGALSQGKFAPALGEATDLDIYTAMQSGPENMPKFSDGQLTPDEKKAIIAFIQTVNKEQIDPGGLPLGGFGPAPEGLVAFVVGMVAIVGVTLWMGSRA